VDPQDEETFRILVSKCQSYNRAVEILVAGKELEEKSEKLSDSNNSLIHDSFVIDQFLESTASQLTYNGLMRLLEVIPVNSLSVYFRNNHFSTIYKNENRQLFTLVTDQGYLENLNVVWETLDNIEGDSVYLTSTFNSISPNLIQELSDTRLSFNELQEYVVFSPS
jgi:hypothetical protein